MLDAASAAVVAVLECEERHGPLERFPRGARARPLDRFRADDTPSRIINVLVGSADGGMASASGE
jgi:hypothetical protein